MSKLIKMNDNNAYSQIQENKENIDILNDEKQENLVSGTTIKTINGESILGEGNIEIEGKSIDAYTKTESDAKYETIANVANLTSKVNSNTKSISTLNSSLESISRNVDKNTSYIEVNADNIATNADEISNLKTSKQDTLVSGTSIKTINGNSLLGSGNISISGGSSTIYAHYVTLKIVISSTTIFGYCVCYSFNGSKVATLEDFSILSNGINNATTNCYVTNLVTASGINHMQSIKLNSDEDKVYIIYSTPFASSNEYKYITGSLSSSVTSYTISDNVIAIE